MRHRVDHRKLGRTHSHRKAMLSNMVTSLFDKSRITTTDMKAKEARRTADRLITRAKKGYAAFREHQSLKEAGKEAEAKQMQAVALAHWRQASRTVRSRSVLKKLFDEIAPQFMEREGGYTRILKLGYRVGDNARTVLLELVGVHEAAEPTPAKGGKGKAAKGAKGAKAEPEAAVEGEAKSKAKPKAKKAAKAAPKETKAPGKQRGGGSSKKAATGKKGAAGVHRKTPES
jgi:large subunit ribosomal protein L17